ncbi:site-specific recombinase XerD [Desulfitispora alkaliphila]|uniref:tyrosine-type recombinase/integrase n=1 Tax=Desulfitispora alkaliphila TaxID=622674 RepID=UPI003D1E54B5
MEKEIRKLVELCEQELTSREYTFNRHRIISMTWEDLIQWMAQREYDIFDECIGFKYCDETFGSRDLSGIQKKDQLPLRAIRMLISYQKEGDFEFRTPSVLRSFSGQSGQLMETYLTHLRENVCLKKATISNKRHYLYYFNNYLEKNTIALKDVNADMIADFYCCQNYSLASKHNCNSTLKLFLRYAYDSGMTDQDNSIHILPDSYKKQRKIPTTYQEEEIHRILKAVERASAIGKRDYVILLLASEYGWRSSDIVNLKFEQIDWDRNTISLSQQKTSSAVIYPLLSSVGNAIIDYLKHGRPQTEEPEIIVSCETGKRGKKLSRPTVHSIVSKYMKRANIRHWQQKKHGPHSLRHSLATNMLKKNVSLPIISTVLGHQNTETTNGYLSLDFSSLKQCALPTPGLKTGFYEE